MAMLARNVKVSLIRSLESFLDATVIFVSRSGNHNDLTVPEGSSSLTSQLNRITFRSSTRGIAINLIAKN
jgi:hypothetical protein